MRRALAGLAIAIGTTVAAPAGAEPWIDYDLLLDRHRDEVVTGTDAGGRAVRTLQLGTVTVTCVQGAGCQGVDRDGAVGCLFSVVAELRAATAMCRLGVPDADRKALDRLYNRVGSYVAANAVPPMAWGNLEGYAGSLSTPDRKGIVRMSGADCEAAAAMAGAILPALRSSEAAAELDRILSAPRLPVMNPCQ